MARRLEAVTVIADIAAPALVGQGETSKIRVILYGTGASLANWILYLIPPGGQALNLTSSLVDLGALFTFITVFEMGYTFQQPGHYTWILNNTATGDVYVTESISAEWATRIDEKISTLKKQRTDIERTYNMVSRLNQQRGK